ncbi:Alpha/beta hydrolase fold-1 [Cristinia sonorae]|uniref:Alpha/beta hydrolase fold-1 n=1 Tax=Cristinia sonorae TaxID=1940300 RepID=A0A8K0XNL1_9AGAR|nr:Alpha/beta hydrolase fold-1 [Cristinia sonorae]
MELTSFIFDPRPQYPLVVTAKRYSHPSFHPDDPHALTLILTHGTGFFKEHWEPTIDHLVNLLSNDKQSRPKIHEIWSLDCPNHGAAAILNEEELQWGYSAVFGWEEYARSVQTFLKGKGTGVPVDFSSRRLVGIGHSMGAISLMISRTYVSPVDFAALILVEPMLLPPAISQSPDKNLLRKGAEGRRDIWPSRAAAFELMQSRPTWKTWDPRILKLYIEHGLRDLPTITYPDKEGVTLTCTRQQEVACYSDNLGRARAYKYLATLCSEIPVHFVHGAVSEPYLPTEIKDYVANEITQGRAASISKVAGAGHLVVQTHPQGLATAIYNILRKESARASILSRL